MKSAFLSLWLLLVCFNSMATTLYVYYPSEITAAVVQKSLSSTCPSLDVTVFGRSKDFREGFEKNTPDVIISLKKVILNSGDFNVLYSGTNKESVEESYLIVSVDKSINTEEIEKMEFGVIDILGRKPMVQYISEPFGKELKLKRVTKVEDLLPLLTFGAVNGVIVTENTFSSIKSKTNLDLKASAISLKSDFISLAVKNNQFNGEVALCLSKFNKDLNDMFGIDGWRTL